jgi:hypothetical protein
MLAGYAVDIFGKRYEMTHDCFDGWNDRSILAQLAQATELYILEPAIDYVINNRDCDIALWQHDGFSLVFSDSSKQVLQLNKVKQLVDERIKEMGIITELEIN